MALHAALLRLNEPSLWPWLAWAGAVWAGAASGEGAAPAAGAGVEAVADAPAS